MPTSPRSRRLAVGGLGLLGTIAVALISINLRLGATSVGPLLQEIRSALGMSSGVAGFMTSLPCLCFGLVGAVAVALTRRMGMTVGIVLGLVAITVTLAVRPVVGSALVFLLLSTIALGGMALGNILVPAWIKRHSTDGGTRGMTIFSSGLALGGALGSLLAAPAARVATGGWRGALGMWALVAAVAVVPWFALAGRERRNPADHATPVEPPRAGLRTSRTAIAMTIYFGMQSMHAYVQFGWLPQIYRDAGLSSVEAGAWLALLGSLGVVGGLIMPTIVSRRRAMTVTVLAFGACLVAGYVGLWLAAATTPWLWALLLGISGWTFPAAIALITARTRNPRVTAQVSGFVQPIGYLIAAVGPIAVGLIHQATGDWTLVLWLLIATGLVMMTAGLVVARSGYVDDEIAL